MDEGNFTLVKLPQSAKAFPPIFVTESGISMLVRFLQYLEALLNPISWVIPAGRITFPFLISTSTSIFTFTFSTLSYFGKH